MPYKNDRRRSTETPETETAIVAIASSFSVDDTFVQEDNDDELKNKMSLDGGEECSIPNKL
jgi:hypothetical protein